MKKYILIWNAKNKKEIDDFKQKKQTEWSQAHATVPENAIVLTSGLSQLPTHLPIDWSLTKPPAEENKTWYLQNETEQN